MNAIQEMNKLSELLQPREDGYLNATLMCRVFDKQTNDWLRLKNTKAVVDALSTDTGIPVSVLVQVIKGGDTIRNATQQGTWIHPDLAVQLAQWLDPQFALFVSRLVRDWFANHQPQQPAIPQDYEAALEAHLQSIRQQKVLEQRIADDKPKVESYNSLMNAEGYYKGQVYAKMLGIGHIRLYRILRNLKIFQSNNIPYQRHIDEGHFVVKQSVFVVNGEKQVQLTTLATPKGVEYLRRRLTKEGYLD
jgi:phage antirepressor YoqD-like protein